MYKYNFVDQMMLKEPNGSINKRQLELFKNKGIFNSTNEAFPEYDYLNFGGNVIYLNKFVENSYRKSNLILFDHLFQNYFKKDNLSNEIDLVLFGGGGLHELPAINEALKRYKGSHKIHLHIIDLYIWPRHQYSPEIKTRKANYYLDVDIDYIDTIQVIRMNLFDALKSDVILNSENTVLYFSRCLIYNEVGKYTRDEQKYCNDLIELLKKYKNCIIGNATATNGTDSTRRFNEKLEQLFAETFKLDAPIEDRSTRLITTGLNYSTYMKSTISLWDYEIPEVSDEEKVRRAQEAIEYNKKLSTSLISNKKHS